MKKISLAILSFALVASSLFLVSSCDDDNDDSTSPVITLSGDLVMTIEVGGTFTDPGATATDDEDGSVSVTVSGTVDVNTAGTYMLTYSATDAAGNTSTKQRTVYVSHSKTNIVGTFEGSGSCTTDSPYGPYTLGAYSSSITPRTGTNFTIKLNNFGDFGTQWDVDAEITGNTGMEIDIPQQTAYGLTLQGSGTINSAGTEISFTYSITDGTYTDNCTETWILQ